MSITGWTRTRRHVPEASAERGLVDSSVLIALGLIDAEELPLRLPISAVTLAELAAGPHATADPVERARRQDRLQRTEATFQALPFNAACARAYGRLYAETLSSGRKPQGRRALDLLIAATALAAQLPLYTTNPRDFQGLGALIEVAAVRTV